MISRVQDKTIKVKVTTVRSKVQLRTNYVVALLHPQLMSLQNINFLHLRVSEIRPRQDFKGQGHYIKVNQGQNYIP